MNEVRALYDESTIRVYQAYSDEIANSALARGTFVSPPFKMDRMTWIKPSFLWMMYRCGWGRKDANQSRILAIDISREGFEWALAHSCPSQSRSMDEKAWKELKETSPVRVQWDPERNLLLQPLDIRAIQIGLSKQAVDLYVHKWIHRITDATPLAKGIHEFVTAGRIGDAQALLPCEVPYHLEPSLESKVCSYG